MKCIPKRGVAWLRESPGLRFGKTLPDTQLMNYCALSGPVGFPTPPRPLWPASLQPQAHPVPGLSLRSLSTPPCVGKPVSTSFPRHPPWIPAAEAQGGVRACSGHPGTGAAMGPPLAAARHTVAQNCPSLCLCLAPTAHRCLPFPGSNLFLEIMQ